MRSKDQIISLLPGMLETGNEPPKGSRIVAMCPSEVAIWIAEYFSDGVVILLNHGAMQPPESAAAVPPNLEVLSCGVSGAQFLPESVFAIVALQHDKIAWVNNSNLEVVAQWLQPGGLLCLETELQWDWRWWKAQVPGSAAGLSALAQSVGLRPEDPPASRLRVWRKMETFPNS